MGEHCPGCFQCDPSTYPLGYIAGSSPCPGIPTGEVERLETILRENEQNISKLQSELDNVFEDCSYSPENRRLRSKVDVGNRMALYLKFSSDSRARALVREWEEAGKP